MFDIQQMIRGSVENINTSQQDTPNNQYELYKDHKTEGTTNSTEQTSGTKTTQKATDYDYDKAAEFGNKEMQLQQPYINANRQLTENYLNSINDIYNKYNPDKVKLLQDDERLANIQALSVALGDLARAFGKSAGNIQGLGMVKVDNDSKFVNMLNKALAARKDRRTAEAEEGLRQVNQMISNLKERYAADKDNQKALKQAYDKGFERYLRDNNTTKTTTSGETTKQKKTEGQNQEWRNHNSQEVKNEKEKLNMARQSLSIRQQRLAHDKAKWDKENIFPNLYYKRFDYNTTSGEALYNSEGLQLTDDEVRKYYSRFQKMNLFEKYIPAVRVDQYGNTRKYYTTARNLKQMKQDIYKLLDESYRNGQAYKDIDNALNKENFKTETLGH